MPVLSEVPASVVGPPVVEASVVTAVDPEPVDVVGAVVPTVVPPSVGPVVAEGS
ncbi:hypothetical protein OV079_38885 [Nannocystis pusilla]|uniref:Uncharacterized protein n=1 Tax=Nannocystis pusilla TaxID=889268 RepID=A0A9X3J095_9BACT|nr:hypothetical protein [Nannocystis pusilla]MCY1011427.1 hypothetical protein [Nannocystis pusilla]